MDEFDLKQLAILMAVNCVRNTVIEDYHADGKLSDVEMKAFNQEVANKLYTFLHFLFQEPGKDQVAFLSLMNMMYPSNWDKPKLDSDFVKAVKVAKRSDALDFINQTRVAGAPKPSKKAAKRTKRHR